MVTMPPLIDVWYGPRQLVGACGNPQRYINLLGRVRGAQMLTYSLDGSPPVEVAIGSDRRRLAGRGDFNIDLPLAELRLGDHQIAIVATDANGTVTQRDVVLTVRRDPAPLPLRVEWRRLTRLDDIVHIVDGQWQVTAIGLSPVEIGYDRLVALGDVSWRDYQVSVPVTVHAIAAGAYEPPSYHAGVGVVLRWQGHRNVGADEWAGARPFFWPDGYGAIIWYCVFPDQGSVINIFDPEFRIAAARAQTLDLHIPYVFKARVITTLNGTSRYYMKVWRQGLDEPMAWDLIANGHPKGLATGSVMLVAHHVACTFGDISVEPAVSGSDTDDGIAT